MPALLTHKQERISIDMRRGDCKVIEHRDGNPDAFKKAWAKMCKINKTIPSASVDTLADLDKTRDSRGQL